MPTSKSSSRLFDDTAKASPHLNKGCVVAIGNYDGIHRGHQEILSRLLSQAKKLKLKSVVFTFNPHPVKVLAPQVAPKLIFTPEQKAEFLVAEKIDGVILQKFDAKFASTTPRDFFIKRLLKDLHAKRIIVGYDFTFGNKRSGTVETLESLGREFGIGIEIVPAQMQNQVLPSSTLIRRLVASGDVATAAGLLGRDFFIDGEVVHGHKRGAALGLHTANLKTSNELLPLDGVYVTEVVRKNRTYGSVTNIGFNPTFHNTERSIETHIFDFDGDLYGEKLRLKFLARLRDEIHFASPEALLIQIKKDIAAAKHILENR